jgi:outer membrane murein-binding lipoprotein Lpp
VSATVRTLIAVVIVVASVATLRPTPVETQSPTVRTLEQRVALLETQIGTLVSQVSALQAANASLQTQINNIAKVPQNVLDLANYVSVDLNTINDLVGPHVIFSGANVHIQNGFGATAFKNGVGNLIVGYNELDTPRIRDGSHNLVVGEWHSYSSYGGLVVGRNNSISGEFASVSGGTLNIASRAFASVGGGASNTASGIYASISGGDSNSATGTLSSVSGGIFNTASGGSATVSGGRSNTASGNGSTVSGGANNVAGNFDSLAP